MPLKKETEPEKENSGHFCSDSFIIIIIIIIIIVPVSIADILHLGIFDDAF